jgi:hypothetical protein
MRRGTGRGGTVRFHKIKFVSTGGRTQGNELVLPNCRWSKDLRSSFPRPLGPGSKAAPFR